MTAEIAVMNRQALALAADSAVTVRSPDGGKVWQSANKIFGLSRHHSVGFMIYGAADLMRVPWETVIKLYRDQMDTTPFDTLEEYRDDFLAFLRSSKALFPAEEQEIFFSRMVGGTFSSIVSRIEEEVVTRIEANGSVARSEVKTIVQEKVRAEQQTLEGCPRLPHLPDTFRKTLLSKYASLIAELRRQIFQKLPLDSGTSRRLSSIAGLLFEREAFSQNLSGVVIAGFGSNQFFPRLITLRFEGVVNGHLNYVEDRGAIISRDNSAGVYAFAQRDVVYSFMEGIDQAYQDLLEDSVHQIFLHYPEVIVDALPNLSEKKKKSLKIQFSKAAESSFEHFCRLMASIRQKLHWERVIDVVDVLPKDELAAMAESLVNLTSFRRKVSLQLETVGGPIDVAVISKGDGFVWIQRKRYFSIEDNHHFLQRYA